MNNNISIQKALVSVSNKTGIIEVAKELQTLGIEILSTGGTAKYLQQQAISTIEVSSYTGFPEIMDGRIKTLHPKIMAGILARRSHDLETIQSLNITPIDLIIVNLYPFEKTVADPKHRLADAIENIDVGGPSMIRAAAKNYHDVVVIVDPTDYSLVLEQLKTKRTVDYPTRFYLAQKAFAHTAQYDSIIADYFTARSNDMQNLSENNLPFPEKITLNLTLKKALRYGENPHQKAALYINADNKKEGSLTNALQAQGKPLSYNNLVDADTALSCVQEFVEPACVIVKHANPCGVAISENIITAYQSAFATDPTSAFGGIIAFNQTIDDVLAAKIINQQFVEVIIAPAITEKALVVFQQKPNIRILITDFKQTKNNDFDCKKISGGLLIQEKDNIEIAFKDLKAVTQRQVNAEELQDLLFAWRVTKYVKSNAIVYAKNGSTLGIGAGQMSRVYSARIAQIKAEDAHLSLTGSVMASDAFFPFRDSVDAAAKIGITAIIQPGGSMRDAEVIEAANDANIAMIFTGIRHFRH